MTLESTVLANLFRTVAISWGFVWMQRFLLLIVLTALFSADPGGLAAADANYMVPEPLFVSKQPTENTCWATVATMMKSWEQKKQLKIVDVMNDASPVYWLKFRNDQGLSSDDKPDFLKALGLGAEPPATYSAQGLLLLMKLYGPLWVTTQEVHGENFSIHARLLIGIAGDGGSTTQLLLIDPADGGKHFEPLDQFTRNLENVAKADYGPNADVRPLIVHFWGSVGMPTNLQATVQ